MLTNLKFGGPRLGLAVGVLIGLCFAWSTQAHQTSGRHNKTQNGQGCSLSHSHPPRCPSNGICMNGQAWCPSSDAVCESALGFSSAGRQYSWTNQWNCHGRTFDNRGSWTGDASLFISCDYGYSPASPQVGDAVVWRSGAEHSATIIGPWNGLSTQVSSKYGCCGGYHHALAEAVDVYGSDWSIIRFTSGSPIFKSLGAGDRPLPKDPQLLSGIRKEMPWFPTVIASATVHAVEKSRLIQQSGSLSESTRKQLRSTDDPFHQLELLAVDLRSDPHYGALAAYNHPRQSLDFIAGVEAGQIMVQLARDFPDEMRETVLRLLRGNALARDASAASRSASVYFLAELLNGREKADLNSLLEFETGRVQDGQIDMVDFYRKRFLEE